MKHWLERATKLLDQSLGKVPMEMNELDWKLDLSPDKTKLAQHLSAFANYEGGGFLAFGIKDNARHHEIDRETAERIVNTLGNIAREVLEPPIQIDSHLSDYKGKAVLFIFISQNDTRPVCTKKNDPYSGYIRSANQTRLLTKAESQVLISRSQRLSFESESCMSGLSPEEVLKLLDVQSYFDLQEKAYPKEISGYLEHLITDGVLLKKSDTYSITNLGAILFAKDLTQFGILKRKSVRVVIYKGTSKLETIKEQEGIKGYASGFRGLLDYIIDQLPTNEVIEKVARRQVKVYPELALRELIANALIHQDFDISGTGPMIEIFSDRIEITNPGTALVPLDRFLDFPPRSRNEKLASLMRRLNLCEERGSGVDKIFKQIEVYQLPPLKMENLESNIRAIIYSPRTISQMTKAERIRACFQHACLKYVLGEPMTNQSLRERLAIPKSNYPLASTIIKDTINEGRIKELDPDSNSKKYMKYIPYWA